MNDILNSDSIPGMVSVIVASYNHAEYLSQRMDSLVNQTYSNIEIIVIDDCSSDNSEEILKKYITYPQVKLIINEKNSGWVKVSNKGISLARGEFIIFANCDDYSDMKQIEKLVNQFINYPSASMCFSKSIMVDEKNNIIGDDFKIRDHDFKKHCKKNSFIARETMEKFLMHSCVIPNLSGLLIRKNCFIKVDGFTDSYRVVSDWDLFFKLSRLGDTVWISESLNYFRQHSETIRESVAEKNIYEEIFDLLSKRLEVLNFTPSEIHKYRWYFSSIWAGYLFRSPKSAIKNFKYHLDMNKKVNSQAMSFLFVKLFVYPIEVFFSKYIA